MLIQGGKDELVGFELLNKQVVARFKLRGWAYNIRFTKDGKKLIVRSLEDDE